MLRTPKIRSILHATTMLNHLSHLSKLIIRDFRIIMVAMVIHDFNLNNNLGMLVPKKRWNSYSSRFLMGISNLLVKINGKVNRLYNKRNRKLGNLNAFILILEAQVTYIAALVKIHH